MIPLIIQELMESLLYYQKKNPLRLETNGV